MAAGDFAAANQGQLKQFALALYEEFVANADLAALGGIGSMAVGARGLIIRSTSPSLVRSPQAVALRRPSRVLSSSPTPALRCPRTYMMPIISPSLLPLYTK